MLYISLVYHASPTREPSSYQHTPTLLEGATRGLTRKSVAKITNCSETTKYIHLKKRNTNREIPRLFRENPLYYHLFLPNFAS